MFRYVLCLVFDVDGTFHSYPLMRENAMKVVVSILKERDIVISTTGMLSRELFEHRFVCMLICRWERGACVYINYMHWRCTIVNSVSGMSSLCLLHFWRVAQKQGHERDFLTVGSMGHASAIALGISFNKPKRQVSFLPVSILYCQLLTFMVLSAGLYWPCACFQVWPISPLPCVQLSKAAFIRLNFFHSLDVGWKI